MHQLRRAALSGTTSRPVAQVYARFADWARKNNISRRQLKLQAKARMIAAAQAAE
jgi:hypothetical protein